MFNFCFVSNSQLFKQVPDLHLTSQLPWCVERATERRTLASQGGGGGAALTARAAGSATLWARVANFVKKPPLTVNVTYLELNVL